MGTTISTLSMNRNVAGTLLEKNTETAIPMKTSMPIPVIIALISFCFFVARGLSFKNSINFPSAFSKLSTEIS